MVQNALLKSSVDPKYEEEVSGCTASVAILSKSKIYVVRGQPLLAFVVV